jgi:anaerobic selenocysteine-containing dehydrogenase
MEEMGMTEKITRKSFCRFCHANCGIEVDIADGRPVQVRGDASDPVFGGYTCLKGRELAAAHTHPDRILHPLKKNASGGFDQISSTQALDEIAEKLSRLIAEHGPRSVASYNGTYAFQNAAALPVSHGFHKGIGSPMVYTSVTIDQPAKVYLWARVGAWGGGFHSFSDADVWLAFGNNPTVSHYAPPGGVPPFSASRRLRDAKARGLKLIVVDPRASELSQLADQYVQIAPGEDAAYLSGIIRVILQEGWHDKAFAQEHIAGVSELQQAVQGFTPDVVALRCGVAADAVRETARIFAHARKGVATTGTGPEMSGRGSLVAHLILALNYLCGRVYRAGEDSPVPKILFPAAPRPAAVTPPMKLWGEGFPKSRVRGLTALGEEMPCATAADEILLPGDGQVKALICVGGNPAVAWPNQEKVMRALKSLDLLVCIDTRLGQTAQLADYVIAPHMCLEREDITSLSEWWYEEPYGRYAEQLVLAPGDTMNEWEFYWEIAKRLGTEIHTAGGPLPMDRKPSTFELFQYVTNGSPVPVADVRAASNNGENGAFFPEAAIRVQEAPPSEARLNLAPDDVMAELADYFRETSQASGFPFKLISRRSKHVFNSTGHDLPNLARHGTANPAYMNPDDMTALGLRDGDLVSISSRTGTIQSIAQASDDLRQGIVSMSHAFGGWSQDNPARHGGTTARLVDDETHYDPITGMVRQSAIPVSVAGVRAA